MPADDSDLIRCGNPACKCRIDPGKTACGDYCTAAQAWRADEVQNDVCGCGHADCGSPAAATPPRESVR